MQALLLKLYEKHAQELQFEAEFDHFELRMEESKDVSKEEVEFIDLKGKVVENDLKPNFLTFLFSKDDNLLLQTSGLLIQLVMYSKTAQVILYYSQMFPLGLNRKSMLLQKLLDDKEESKDEPKARTKRGSPSH